MLHFDSALRTKKITYAIRDVVVEAQKVAKTGKKIYYLNIGDPLKYDFRTPSHLWKAVTENKKESESYGDSLGIIQARQSIAKHMKKYNVKGITENDVLMGNGASENIQLALGSTINPGENILLPAPGYPLYSAAAKLYGIKEKQYYLDPENNWEPDIDSIRKQIDKKTKVISLINPNNPTGSLYSKKTIKEILNIAGQHKLIVFSDEIYNQMIISKDKFYSTASLASDIPIITFNGLSKNYLATGFRVGWSVFNSFFHNKPQIKEANFQLARARLCSVHPFQFSVKAALEGNHKHIKETNSKLRKRANIIHKRMNGIDGISVVKPKATFYAFPKIEKKIFKTDKEFVLRLLKETGVCTVFGSGFSDKLKGQYFRIVFLPFEKELNEAIDHIDYFVKKHSK